MRIDNGDGTVTDTLGGLQWQQSVDPGSYDQPGAVALCSALVLGGYAAGAWRLPSIAELESILDLTRTNPPVDPTYFPGTPTAYHWTSSVNPGNPADFWGVLFFNGADGYVTGASMNRVRCVH